MLKIGKREFSRQELRDALRMGIQSAAAAAATLALMRAGDLSERFVGVISAVLVVQPSVGGTLGSAKQRFAATVVGLLVGLACLYALPTGYGTLIALAISMTIMGFIARLWPDWKYGAVAAVALALGSDGDAWVAAQERAIAIGGGALIGTLATLVVWPDSAKKRAERHLKRALASIADRLEAIVEAAKGQRSDSNEKARDGYHSAINDARAAAGAMHLNGRDTLSDKIRYAEQLYNSILILKRIVGDGFELESDEEEFAPRMESTARLGAEIARDLASDSLDDPGRIEELRSELEEGRRSAVDRDNPDLFIHRHAAIFGLDQVEDCLSRLLELEGGKESD